MQRRSLLIHNHSQGMLHWRPDKVQCGVHWQHRQSQILPLCSRMTRLLTLLKFYGHNQVDKVVSLLYIVLPTAISSQCEFRTTIPHTRCLFLGSSFLMKSQEGELPDESLT